MERLYKAYKDKAQFFLVYTREIHPSREKGPTIAQHKTLEDRKIAADKCMKGLKLTIPTLLDTMDNLFAKTYGGIPAGTTVIDVHGKIAYWTRGAPKGCKPHEAEEVLKKLLAEGGGPIEAEWAKVRIRGAETRTEQSTKERKRWF